MRDFSKYTKHSTRQEGRFLPTLDFDYVKIDERNFEDLLRFVYGLSKLICYYDEHNKLAGDWSDFLNDELIVLSAIQQAEPGQTEIRFRQAAEKALLFRHPEKKGAYFEKCLREVYGIAQDINAWLHRLKQIEQFANVQLDLRDEILNLIDTRLGTAFRQLLGIHRAAQEILYPYTNLDTSEFHPLWRVSEAPQVMTWKGIRPAIRFAMPFMTWKPFFKAFMKAWFSSKTRPPITCNNLYRATAMPHKLPFDCVFATFSTFTNKPQPTFAALP
ncbi:MAG: hypothetical protein HC913_16270 [Microscillaceae bacterium]|nr:hypothetical protein [Microscillaceae bacterium]